MNIFWLDADPKMAAQYHCDKHVVKMIIETAQLLSTAIHIANGHVYRKLDIYKPTHMWHPCAKWVRQSRHNFRRTIDIGLALCSEYEMRYRKRHKTRDIIERIAGSTAVNYIDDAAPMPIVQAFPKFFHQEDPVRGYRIYYAAAKYRIATWNKVPRGEPVWWESMRQLVKIRNWEIENDKNDYVDG